MDNCGRNNMDIETGPVTVSTIQYPQSHSQVKISPQNKPINALVVK